MTGFLQTSYTNTNNRNNSNYMTTMTLGALEDSGFTVNYNSEYVSNTGTYLAEYIVENSITNDVDDIVTTNITF